MLVGHTQTLTFTTYKIPFETRSKISLRQLFPHFAIVKKSLSRSRIAGSRFFRIVHTYELDIKLMFRKRIEHIRRTCNILRFRKRRIRHSRACEAAPLIFL